ncbi:MAG: glycosyltransferase family 9 protein [Gemmatimonadaceae bacterium]|nr:glycosyltransferase family 9 protein [Gemmatimonadaceae bacterium]
MAWRDAAESLRLAGRIQDGLDAAAHAATLAPTDASIANTTALLLYRSGAVDAALARCQQARVNTPDDIHLALTHAMLLRTFEQYDEGWALYERRLELPDLQRRPHAPATPRWRGEPLAGRSMLVRAEQGLGDQVQFVRWACLLRAQGASRVIVQAAPPLLRLLRTAPDIDVVAAADQPAPTHDVHVDLLSLPHLLHTGTDMRAQLVPYLSAPGAAPQVTAAIPPKPMQTLRIGVVWGGTPLHADDASRSIPLDTLVSVLTRNDVQVVVLQQGDVRTQLDALSPDVRAALIDVAPLCTDMGDTAYAIAQCDVVLSVDTSVAHVAGALGIPTWVMVAEPAEWRWGRDRTDSIFYPSVRVFRQQRPGDWSAVIADLHRSITRWLEDHAA